MQMSGKRRTAALRNGTGSRSPALFMAAALISVLAATSSLAGPSAMPWSDGDSAVESAVDENGNKIKLTKAEKAARAKALAPTMTAMLTDPAFPASAAAQTSIDVKYVVFMGGFHLSTMAFSMALDGNDYQIRSNIHTDGVVDKFVKTNANIGSRGTFGQRGGLQAKRIVSPLLYNSDITDKKQRQLVSIAYAMNLPTQILSFPKYNLKKNPVSDLDKRKTLDPVSAIMQIALGASATAQNPCGGKIPVFDGRRRFDITLDYVKTEDISTGKGDAYNGPALKCWVGFKRVSGYKPKKKKRGARSDGRSEWPDVYMWLAPIEGQLSTNEQQMYVPVRFLAKTGLGTVISRAVKLDVKHRIQTADVNSPSVPAEVRN